MGTFTERNEEAKSDQQRKCGTESREMEMRNPVHGFPDGGFGVRDYFDVLQRTIYWTCKYLVLSLGNRSGRVVKPLAHSTLVPGSIPAPAVNLACSSPCPVELLIVSERSREW